jgi:tight adherence protein C
VSNTLMIAAALAMLAALCAVLFLGYSVFAALERREKLWSLTRAGSASLPAAVQHFMRLILLETVRPLSAVQNILRTVKKNLATAGYSESADDFVSSSLWQGLLAGAALCVFGILLFSTTLGLILGISGGLMWALWMRPALLDADASKRARAIYRRIPYALDLSVLVLETGGTLREGLEEIAQHEDPLAEELRLTLLEMDSGASQSAALKNMGQRIGLESLEAILTAINRGEETGAPMVTTLVNQAEMFRERRLQEIEKLAVEAPAKMTFPNMMIMVSVLLLIVGPLLIQLVSSGIF